MLGALQANKTETKLTATFDQNLPSMKYIFAIFSIKYRIYCRRDKFKEANFKTRTFAHTNMLYLSALSTNLPPPYLGNARRDPSPSRWPARTTLPTLAKSQLRWHHLCDVVLLPSRLVEYALTAICVLLSQRSSTH